MIGRFTFSVLGNRLCVFLCFIHGGKQGQTSRGLSCDLDLRTPLPTPLNNKLSESLYSQETRRVNRDLLDDSCSQTRVLWPRTIRRFYQSDNGFNEAVGYQNKIVHRSIHYCIQPSFLIHLWDTLCNTFLSLLFPRLPYISRLFTSFVFAFPMQPSEYLHVQENYSREEMWIIYSFIWYIC